MRERPILFNADMVRAVLDGRKTQTRRIIQERHLYSGGRTAGNWPVHMPEGEEGEKARIWAEGNSPFGAVGDRLWVRETWSDVNLEGASAVAYRADEGLRCLTNDNDDGDEDDPRIEKYSFANWYPDLISGTEGIWRPSIHMPRWASRITLEITGVRVERMYDISEADARAEGVEQLRGGFWRHYQPGWTQHQLSARGSFVTLWKSIYGEESWQANPWVWVIEFKRVEVE